MLGDGRVDGELKQEEISIEEKSSETSLSLLSFLFDLFIGIFVCLVFLVEVFVLDSFLYG